VFKSLGEEAFGVTIRLSQATLIVSRRVVWVSVCLVVCNFAGKYLGN